MGKGPKWFRALPKKSQDAIEQFGHFWMGYAARLVLADLWWWWRESIKQWPPGMTLWFHEGTKEFRRQRKQPDGDGWEGFAPHDRVWDTFLDWLFKDIGATCASLTHVGLTAWWVMSLYDRIRVLEAIT